MKAITYERYGPPDVLQVSEVAEPTLRDDEILIRVRAAEATKSDCEMRSFEFSVSWFWLPLRLALGVTKPRRSILGLYFAGDVEAIGANVRDISVGDALLGCTGMSRGAYGELLTIPATNTHAPKPVNMTYAEAAAVPLGGLNALHFMRLAEVQPGEQVLVNGAGGVIGSHGVQIAKAMGAEVTAVDSSVKREFLERIGVDHFVDYEQEDFTSQKGRYDVVFDMVPTSSYSGCIGVLKPNGRYLCGNPRLSTMLRSILTNRFSDKTARVALARETREELRTLVSMIEAGDIVSIVDRVLPMEQAPEAHRLVETEQRKGAIVLEICGT